MPLTPSTCIQLAPVLGWLALAAPVAAQSMLGGVIRDPNGQVVADAVIFAQDDVTGQPHQTRSSTLGLYAFFRLPPARYIITVTLPPYAPFVTVVDVRGQQKT